MRRSEQRRAAVIAAYQHDLTGHPLEDTLGRDAAAFTRALAQAAADAHARARRADRQARARLGDRRGSRRSSASILRVALVEMLHGDAVPADAPISPEGAIDEAVESAKTFCGADAPGFVNGILDAILREVRENEKSR